MYHLNRNGGACRPRKYLTRVTIIIRSVSSVHNNQFRVLMNRKGHTRARSSRISGDNRGRKSCRRTVRTVSQPTCEANVCLPACQEGSRLKRIALKKGNYRNRRGQREEERRRRKREYKRQNEGKVRGKETAGKCQLR